MTKVYAMYRQPADPAAFDRYYSATHVPIAKRLPGLAATVGDLANFATGGVDVFIADTGNL